MKPGMQRDLLVAYWLLFDEFEIGEDDPPVRREEPAQAPAPAVQEPEKAKRPNGGKNRRR